MSMLVLIGLVLTLYISIRLVLVQKWPWWLRAVACALVAAGALQHGILLLFFGGLAAPHISATTQMVLGWAFGSVCLVATMLLLCDLAALLVGLVSRAGMRKLLTAHRPKALVALGLMGLSAYGVAQAIRVPDVKNVEIRIPGLPAALDGFRMVQLTDLHVSHLLQKDWLSTVVQRTIALNPNVVVITGDLVDGSVAERADAISPLRQLAASQNVITIPGNHEYYTNYQDWIQHFTDMGMPVLRNSRQLLQYNGSPLAIVGVTDKAAEKKQLPMPDITQALAGIDANTPVILLQHRPEPVPVAQRPGVVLQLSGHTHGGHIVGLNQIVKLANGGLVSGLYQVEGMQVYVGPGTGLWAGFPIRIGVPSEITQITLRAG